MSISNDNYATGGTGGAIFGGPQGAAPVKVKPGHEAIGDEYKMPAAMAGQGMTQNFDDDDRINPAALKAGEPSGKLREVIFGKCFPDPRQQGLMVAKMFYFFFFSAFGSLFPLMGVYFKQLGMDAAQAGFLSGVRPIIEYLASPFWSGISDRFQKGKVLLMMAVASWILFTLPLGFIHPPVVSCKWYNSTSGKFMLKDPNLEMSKSVIHIPGIPLPTQKRLKRSLELERGTDSNHFDIMPPPGHRLTPDTVDELPRALPLTMDDKPKLTLAGNRGTRRYRQNNDHVPRYRVKREDIAANHRWSEGDVKGKSPQTIDFFKYDAKYRTYAGHERWVSPRWNNEVFEQNGVNKAFFLMILLVIIGEFFSSPAIALADSAVLSILGEEEQDKYSSQRMFGSIGWGVTMFVMGMVLDHSRVFQEAKCQTNEGQRNYNVCFFVFSLLMFIALFVGFMIPFKYKERPGYNPKANNSMPMNNVGNGDQGHQKPMDQKDKLKDMANKTKVFANQLRGMPDFIAVFKLLANLRLLMCMLVALIMGAGIGLISTFLFWHLQDFGGTPTLFGIASVINHISEMCAFFLVTKVIGKIGHVKVLAFGLLCNCLRFLYISFITWPWLVLPFEFVQGITHAGVWAAMSSLIAHNTEPELRPSTQGFLQGIHHGFGKFCGAVFGGMLIKEHGTILVFRIYAIVCAVFLVLFIVVNFYSRNEGGISSELPEDLDPKTLAEEGGHLAPHGVPGSHMPRALSGQNLNEEESQMLGQEANPGDQTNPFLQEQYAYDAAGAQIPAQQQAYYGGGYTQAQSGYSSSGYGLQ